jgi:hypothetical protein
LNSAIVGDGFSSALIPSRLLLLQLNFPLRLGQCVFGCHGISGGNHQLPLPSLPLNSGENKATAAHESGTGAASIVPPAQGNLLKHFP